MLGSKAHEFLLLVARGSPNVRLLGPAATRMNGDTERYCLLHVASASWWAFAGLNAFMHVVCTLRLSNLILNVTALIVDAVALVLNFGEVSVQAPHTPKPQISPNFWPSHLRTCTDIGHPPQVTKKVVLEPTDYEARRHDLERKKQIQGARSYSQQSGPPRRHHVRCT